MLYTALFGYLTRLQTITNQGDDSIKISLIEYPTDSDWMEVKRRALVTAGLSVKNAPTLEWKRKSLNARHSHIRRLWFSFYFEDIPFWVSVHFCRHVHAQPYVRSQRNDRQSDYDRNKAPQDAPVNMILDVNAEELMTIMNKRLCSKASEETRRVAELMREEVLKRCPEFSGFLVPMCDYHGGVCREMVPCGRCEYAE